MGRTEFLSYLTRRLGTQLLFLVVFSSLYLWAKARNNFDLQLLVLFVCISFYGWLLTIFANARAVQRRLLAIYPKVAMTYTRSSHFLEALQAGIIAIFWLFLIFKKEDHLRQRLPFIFRHPKWVVGFSFSVLISPMLISFVALRGDRENSNLTERHLSTLNYWLSSPVVFFVTDISIESRELRDLKIRTYNLEATALSKMEASSMDPPRTFIGEIELINIFLWRANRLKKEYASAGPEAQITKSVQDIISILRLGELNPPNLLRYNPIVFLPPTGFLAALVVESWEIPSICVIFKLKKLFEKLEERLDQLEPINKLSAQSLRRQLFKTKLYQQTKFLHEESWMSGVLPRVCL